MAVMKGGELRIIAPDGRTVERQVHVINWSGAMAEKGGYKHFMLKEIFEQPRAIADTLLGRVKEERGEVEFEELKLPPVARIRRVWMIACGTSYHACMIGKHMFEENLRLPVEVDIASEFRYRNPVMGKNDMLILVSQSGETADTIAVMKEAKKRGIFTLAICNVLGSTLARDSDGVIFTHAGPEIGVASTKAFTTQISVLFLLTLHLGKRLGVMDQEALRLRISEIRKIPHKLQLLLDGTGDAEDFARSYMHYKNFLYLGRGISYPVSLEGALKLKEISYIHAEAYAAGEMKHGPIALIDEQMPVVFVSPNDQTYKKTCSNVEEVVSRRGQIILCTDFDGHEMASKASNLLLVPQTLYELQPLISIVPLQLFAYHIANLLGTDVDQPRNLAKSVTVE
jgi:glucosamine--fructose-6-phosphate aminotransferase (isomerizing)